MDCAQPGVHVRHLRVSQEGRARFAPEGLFVEGAVILRESTSFALLCGFALVWIALAILGFDGVRHRNGAPAVAAA